MRTMKEDPSAKSKEVGRMGRKYHCYNPINMQSDYLGVNGGHSTIVDALENNIDVIGLIKRFEQSICLIFVYS